jgi:hypothetical protein
MKKKAASPRPSPKERGKKANSSSPKNDRLISFIVFAFAFLLYANTLNHGFSGIGSILHHSFIFGFTGHNDQSYRPVVSIIFAVEKQFFGNNPHTGHFINVLLFALSCVLLLQLVKRLFKALPWGEGLGGVAVVLLFASHPIHTEAVANIKGRDDILNFIFFVLSLSYILKHIDEGGKKYFFLSVLFFFLSLMCKEMAVTFLAIIPLTVLVFRHIPLKKIGMGLISFVAAFGVYMFIRSSVLETVTFAEKMKVVNNALAAATNGSDRIATAILILGKYLFLLIFPYPLSWDYSFNQIPIVSFSDIKVIITLLVFGGLGIYAFLSLVKLVKSPVGSRQLATSTVYSYCIFFFFITMSVVSNIFIMIGSTLGERFLFVPSMAFCIVVAYAIHPSPTLPKGERGSTTSPPLGGGFRWGVLVVVLALFSFKTFDRNKDWKDNFSLFAAGVEATPNSSRAESALGSSYREMGEKELDPNKRLDLFKKAIPYYQKAIEILPDNTEALYNAGVAYYGIGDKENALKVYEQALKSTPEYTNAANNAGVIYFERKDYENAKKYFLQAIKYAPDNSDALGNLGAIAHNTGNLKEAIEYYKHALQINPANQNVQGNLAKAENTLAGKK